MALAGGATLAGGNCILRSHPGPGVVTRAWQSVNAASKARRARFCVKPFRPRHHRLPRGPSREAVVSVCLMHPTKGFRPMTGSTVRMPSNLSLTDCKARVTSRAQGAIGVCSSHPQASRHYHQRQRRPYGPHQQWRRGPKPNRRPRPQPLCHRIAVRGLPSRRRLGLALRLSVPRSALSTAPRPD